MERKADLRFSVYYPIGKKIRRNSFARETDGNIMSLTSKSPFVHAGGGKKKTIVVNKEKLQGKQS